MWLKATSMWVGYTDLPTSWQLTRFYEINTNSTHLRIFNACWISYGKYIFQIYDTGSSINYTFPEMLHRFCQLIVSDILEQCPWANTAQNLQTSTLLQDLLYCMGAFNHRTTCRLPRSAWTECFWTCYGFSKPPSSRTTIPERVRLHSVLEVFITISRTYYLKEKFSIKLSSNVTGYNGPI
jgi:hypothetical protein